MKRPKTKLRNDRVTRCRARIAAGYYDSPAVLARILGPRVLNAVLSDLDKCPVGDGNTYRDLAAEFLSRCLGDVVDEPMVSTEFNAAGGRGDIDLPLRLEALADHPLWLTWAQRYDVNCIVVEAKNEAAKTDTAAVQQIASYLELAGRGRLGMIVSRRGFTANAMEQMSEIAKRGKSLILPIQHDDLPQLARASRSGIGPVTAYLRRRQTLLVQQVP